MSILVLLIQFVFRVTFGVAFAMAVTPSRHVSSGFYRVHLWVLMGLNTLASLVVFTKPESLASSRPQQILLLSLAIGLALLSYAGAVLWLYEQKKAGNLVLNLIALAGFAAAALATPLTKSGMGTTLDFLDLISSGLLLGTTLAAMFLGHWYLNTPTMELSPLKRLVVLMAAFVIFRALVNAAGLSLEMRMDGSHEPDFWIFIALRWLSGLVGALLMAWMTWHTLRIPNTQSATGILYAGVILTFIGELTSQFLSSDAQYPL